MLFLLYGHNIDLILVVKDNRGAEIQIFSMAHPQISSEWLTLWIKDNRLQAARKPVNHSSWYYAAGVWLWDLECMRCMAKWTYALMNRLAPYYLHESSLFIGMILDGGCHCFLTGTHLPKQTQDQNPCSFLVLLLKWVMCELLAYISAVYLTQSRVHNEKVWLLFSVESNQASNESDNQDTKSNQTLKTYCAYHSRPKIPYSIVSSVLGPSSTNMLRKILKWNS